MHPPIEADTADVLFRRSAVFELSASTVKKQLNEVHLKEFMNWYRENDSQETYWRYG